MVKQRHEPGPPMTLGNMRVITETLKDDLRNLIEPTLQPIKLCWSRAHIT
jgi:hypothetical protein